MTDQFRRTFLALCNSDDSIEHSAIGAALALLAGKAGRDMEDDRLLSREEVAAMIHRTPRTVDSLCQRGIFRRVVLAGNDRATGILASSVINAMKVGADRPDAIHVVPTMMA